jgi:uncharacterized membrane protein YkoI
MSNEKSRLPLPKLVAAGAVALGLAAGSYGIASAAGGSSSTGTNAQATTAQSTASAPSAQNPWGRQRSDETLLAGDTESKVRAAALAEVPNATVVRVETDADGNAAYEVHVIKTDGAPATVYVDTTFAVVGVATR